MVKFATILLTATFFAFTGEPAAFASAPKVQEVSQSRVVTGLVVDENNEPLIGVTVKVVGGKEGTVTDLNGKFSIKMPEGKNSLSFEYIGYGKQTVATKGKGDLRVTMKETSQQLEEVVMIGYGVQRKSHLTGSIAKVKTDDLEDLTTARLDEALQGKAAGLQVLNVSSYLGDDPDIVVRGTSSFSADSKPLVVVDGYPYEDGIDAINPGDVKTVEVLKDAAAAAIYGSRAANGVIMITTKSGEANKPQFSFKTKIGTRSVYEYYDLMSTTDYIHQRMRDNELTGGTLSTTDIAQYILAQHKETNWQKEAMQENPYYIQGDLSVSGGNKRMKYYISGAYNHDMGILKKNYYKRFNVRARIDADLTKNVKIGINIAPSYTKSERPGTDFRTYYRQPSWLPAQHDAYTAAITGREIGEYAMGAHFSNCEYTGINPLTGEEVTVRATPWNSNNSNPACVLAKTDDPIEQYRIQIQAYLEIQLMKGLKFRTANSFSYFNKEETLFRSEGARSNSDPSRAYYTNDKTVRLSSENTLTYDYQYDDIFSLNALLGSSVYQNTTTKAGILGFDFATDFIHSLSAAGRIDQYEGSSLRTGTWKSDDAMASFYGRLNFSLLDRYLLSGTLRTDGSSKFGKDKRWGWFPSVAAGWRVSEEPFIKGKIKWLDQLKLRVSYGLTGTNSIQNYANTDLLNAAPYVLGTGNGTVTNGFANNSSSLGNRLLQWEQTGEFNIGFDLSILKNRINLSFDFYNSQTKSLLYQKSISSVSGYNKAWTNEGKLRNRGVEIELNTFNIKTKNFRWNSSVNFSLNRNKLLDLGGPKEQITLGSNKEYYIARVGSPLIQFYGFKQIGIWNNQEEIDANPHHTSDRPGGIRVWDADNNGMINDDDRVPLGDPYPDFTWGFGNEFRYKNWDLSFLFQGQVGGKVFNATGNDTEMLERSPKYTTGRWLSEEHTGNGHVPYRSFGLSLWLTDYLIEDASYAALRNLTLGYTVPKKLLRKAKIKSVRVYFSGQNLLYFMADGYRGVNPEARSGSKAAMCKNAAQRGSFPIMRTYNIGFNFNF